MKTKETKRNDKILSLRKRKEIANARFKLSKKEKVIQGIPNGNPVTYKSITYKNYEKFDSLKFSNELKIVLTKENIANCTKFEVFGSFR